MNGNKVIMDTRSELKDSRKSDYDFNKLRKRLRRETGKAIEAYNMIESGDRIMVCLSGGKDSYTLLDMLMSLRQVAPIDFELIAVNLDQNQPDYPKDVLPNYLKELDVDYKIIDEDTYSTVKRVIPAGKTMCSLCSRLRRGVLYRVATELGCTKIALGHHREDIIETFFLNLFFNGSLKAMPPKLLTDDKQHIVIRPLAFCREKDIAKYAMVKGFPIIPCNLCGSQENLQRKKVKKTLAEWERSHPGRVASIFNALQNVALSQLADPKSFDFYNLATKLNDPNLLPTFDLPVY